MEIQGKVFVVTGGGNGIGREQVLQILKKGGKAMDLYYRLMPKHAARIIYNQMKSIMPS